jgi:energy-converting hydrogenase Eha subunit A
MIWFVVCAALVASVISAALFVYWRRDKPARRPYRDAAFVALGVMWGLFALTRYLGHSGPRWMVWVYAALAVAAPISIWEARRKDARDEERN